MLTHLEPLDHDALRRILTEPKNSIVRQYIKLFRMDKIELTFTTEALDYIVDKAVEYKLGARGLRSLAETVMMPVMYDLPHNHVDNYTVTLDFARRQIEAADMLRLQAGL